MYSNWPSQTEVTLTANSVPQQSGIAIPGDQIPGIQLNAQLEIERQKTPGKVAILLQKFGWKECGTHPDNQQQMWSKQPADNATDEVKAAWDADLKNGYWMWYEAMAYEFGKFISIDTDVDWSKSHPSNVGGSEGATQQQAPAGV